MLEMLAPPSSSELDADEGVKHHSFSAINTYASYCSLQYYFRYIERRLQECVGDALVFGGAVNDALVAIDEDLGKGVTPRPSKALEALRGRLEAAFGNPDLPVVTSKGEVNLEELYEKGLKMVAHYLKNLQPDEVPLLDISRRFTVPLLDEDGDALPRPLKGEFDRIVRAADGSIGIVDWKTAAARWSASRLAKDDQATAYMMAGELLLGKRPAFFRYDLLLKTKAPSIERYHVERTKRDERRLVKKVRVIDRAIQSGVFVPNDGSWSCPTCSFRNACSKWQG